MQIVFLCLASFVFLTLLWQMFVFVYKRALTYMNTGNWNPRPDQAYIDTGKFQVDWYTLCSQNKGNISANTHQCPMNSHCPSNQICNSKNCICYYTRLYCLHGMSKVWNSFVHTWTLGILGRVLKLDSNIKYLKKD